MATNFDISAVIPVYNCERYVADAIRSVLDQSLKPREVIVVNDGSTDRTGAILSSFGGQIRVISQSNSGVSTARNVGIRASTSQWVAQLDSDDVWHPTKLETLAEAVQAHPEVGLVFSAVSCKSERTNRSWIRRRTHDVGCDTILEELLERNAILGGCSGPVIRRTCFDETGGFDESLKGAEDWDMWIRIAFRHELLYVDEPLVHRRVRGGSLSQNVDMMLESDVRVHEKHAATFRSRGVSRWRLRRALSGIYARAGETYFWNGEIRRAGRVLTNALAVNPLNRKAAVAMAKLALGIRYHQGKRTWR